MSIRTLLHATCLCAALFPLGNSVVAQDKKTRVVLYKERLAAQFDTVDCVKNIFKINPLLFFRGETPLLYERALTPKLSLEVGVGVTLRNYLALSFVGDDADDFGAGTKIVPNLSFHVGARFYLADDLEPQGWYIHPEFAHLAYTKDIRAKGPDGKFTDDMYRDERTYNDLRLLAGYQSLSASSNWVMDLYGGIGFRSRNQVVVNETHFISNDPDVSDSFTYEVKESSDNVPALFLGVKFGLGF